MEILRFTAGCASERKSARNIGSGPAAEHEHAVLQFLFPFEVKRIEFRPLAHAGTGKENTEDKKFMHSVRCEW